MKRTSRMIIALCLPLVLCGPASAQHVGPYLGASFGGDALMTAKSADSKGDFSLKFDPGLQWGGVAGWDFAPGNPVGEGRIELEYTHRKNRLTQARFAEGSFNADGDLKADSLLLNFIGVFRDNRRWAPYILAGVGAARMEASDLKVTGNPLANGSQVVFAYQLGTGVDFNLTKHLSLDLGYRFFSSVRPEFVEATGQKFRMDYYSHNATLGLRVGF